MEKHEQYIAFIGDKEDGYRYTIDQTTPFNNDGRNALGENLIFFANLFKNELECERIQDIINSTTATSKTEFKENLLSRLSVIYGQEKAIVMTTEALDVSFFKQITSKRKHFTSIINKLREAYCENLKLITYMSYQIAHSYSKDGIYVDNISEFFKNSNGIPSFMTWFGGMELASVPCKCLFRFTESEKENRCKIKPLFYFDNATSLFLCEFMQIVNSVARIKKCANCGKFFIPSSRSDEIYCNNVFKNNKTCKEIGYEEKINSNEILKEYRKKYKSKNAFKNRNKLNHPNIEQEFDSWHLQAKQKLSEVQKGVLPQEDFIKWLNMEGICDGKHTREKK